MGIGMNGPRQARHTRTATEVHDRRVRRETSIQRLNDLSDQEEMQRRKIHGKRCSLSRAAEGGVDIRVLTTLDVQR